ncbi:hypothetical protein WJX72_007471 [[Myrmecia] bisecta]|uniref:CCDC66 domain-containing protein n=1 Tax=[Myrmecia] bisecta TaxID=41462 RepID=A0AAW1R775_9CHLO
MGRPTDHIGSLLGGGSNTAIQKKEQDKQRNQNYAAELAAQIREKEMRRKMERQASLRQSQDLLAARMAVPSGLLLGASSLGAGRQRTDFAGSLASGPSSYGAPPPYGSHQPNNQAYGLTSAPSQAYGTSSQAYGGPLGRQPSFGQAAAPAMAQPSGIANLGAHRGSDAGKMEADMRKAAYRAELEAQMRQNKEAKEREKQAGLQDDLRKHQEAVYYDPFGKGGGGAPLRNAQGQIMTDLSHVRKMQQEQDQQYQSRSPPGRQQYPAAYSSQQPSYQPGPSYAGNQGESGRDWQPNGAASSSHYESSSQGMEHVQQHPESMGLPSHEQQRQVQQQREVQQQRQAQPLNGQSQQHPQHPQQQQQPQQQTSGAQASYSPGSGKFRRQPMEDSTGANIFGGGGASNSFSGRQDMGGAGMPNTAISSLGQNPTSPPKVQVYFRSDKAYMLPAELAAKQAQGLELAAELQRQIDEKKRLKEEEKRREREAEEAEERRLREEQARMEQKFAEEQAAERTKRALEAGSNEAVEQAWIQEKAKEGRGKGPPRSSSIDKRAMPTSPELAAATQEAAAAAAKEMATVELERMRADMALETAKMRAAVEKQQEEVAVLLQRAQHAEEVSSAARAQVAALKEAAEHDRIARAVRQAKTAEALKPLMHGLPEPDYGPIPVQQYSRYSGYAEPQPDALDLEVPRHMLAGRRSYTNPGDYGASVRDSLAEPAAGGASPPRGKPPRPPAPADFASSQASSSRGAARPSRGLDEAFAINESLAAESQLIYPKGKGSGAILDSLDQIIHPEPLQGEEGELGGCRPGLGMIPGMERGVDGRRPGSQPVQLRALDVDKLLHRNQDKLRMLQDFEAQQGGNLNEEALDDLLTEFVNKGALSSGQRTPSETAKGRRGGNVYDIRVDAARRLAADMSLAEREKSMAADTRWMNAY